MYEHTVNIRVRYAETDKMGYVYYGNYATYFEVGRVELLRSRGVSYRSLEDKGILLPVVNLNVNYLKPAYYDDELTLVTRLVKLAGVKIVFEYELKREKDVLCKAETTLVFLEESSGKPVRIPQEILDVLSASN